MYNCFRGSVPYTQSVEDLVFKAQLAGVNKVVTFPFPSTCYYDPNSLVANNERKPSGVSDFPYQIENLALIKSCEQYEATVFPFSCVDPSTKQTEQLEFLAKLAAAKKIFGLKLHTLASKCTPGDLTETGFIDLAISFDLPILVHCSLKDELSHPTKSIKLAKEFPSLRLCIAHLAWLDEGSLREIARIDNLFVDCCPFLQICDLVRLSSRKVSKTSLVDPSDPAKSLLKYFDLLKDHLIWGTDEPWTRVVNMSGKIVHDHSYEEETTILVKLYDLSAEAVMQITNRNTLAFLFGS